VHVPDLIRVHKTRIAHHVAAIRQINRQHRAAAVLHGRRTVMMQMFVFVRANIAARENFLKMLRELCVNRHQIFEMPVLRAVLDHPNLAVAFHDLGLDLAHFFVHQNVDGQMAIQNLLPNLRYALRTKRIGRAGPTQRRLRFFPGLEQRLLRPLWDRSIIRSNAVEALKDCPCAGGGNRHDLLDIFDRLVHSALAFLHLGVRTVPRPRERSLTKKTYPRINLEGFDAWNGSD